MCCFSICWWKRKELDETKIISKNFILESNKFSKNISMKNEYTQIKYLHILIWSVHLETIVKYILDNSEGTHKVWKEMCKLEVYRPKLVWK